MSDDAPKKVRQRLKVRVRTDEARQPKHQNWVRLCLNALFWTGIIVALVLLNYWLLGRFGNPPPAE
jgi:hypothetical protein